MEKMPSEFKGKILNKNPYTKTTSRKWTKKEIEYLKNKKEEGYTFKEIAESMDRSLTSIKIKWKRLHKSNKTYNKEHVNEKRKCNQLFLNKINPKTILDVFSGGGTPEYKSNKYTVISNDISKDVTADYHLDYLKFLCLMYSENRKFDYVDLDPFGSAYDGFDLAIKMANKGLAITLGEMGHVRWKRLDFVKYRYDITCIEDFTSDNLIKKIKEIGRRNHKDLEVYLKKDWHNISRVWFIINPYKETSQWKNKDKEEQKTLFN